jgi:hypothetical protein
MPEMIMPPEDLTKSRNPVVPLEDFTKSRNPVMPPEVS